MRKILLIVFTLAFVLYLAIGSYAQPEMPPVSAGSFSLSHTELLSGNPDTNRFSLYLSQDMRSEDQLYADSFVSKGADGVINTATFWADVPREISRVSQDKGFLAGCTLGFAKGMAQGSARAVAGVYDVTTFALPPYDQPLMQPAYKVNRPSEEGFKINLLTW